MAYAPLLAPAELCLRFVYTETCWRRIGRSPCESSQDDMTCLFSSSMQKDIASFEKNDWDHRVIAES